MSNWQLKTPVVFIIFKRSDTTEKVFQAIRQAKPQKLLVIADGARLDIPGEAEKCTATRAIIDKIDWDCEVLKNYADFNMGCGKRVATGLDWVFENVEEAIILEDDCVPHHTFFPFCENLLERYRDDRRILSVSGQNLLFGRKRTQYSYYYSHYTFVWGWATWKRAWQHFDFDMKLWSEIKERNFLHDILGNSQAVKDWSKILQKVYDGRIDTWDYRWMFSCWVQNGLHIHPNVNLVSNIGFGLESTHTSGKRSKYAEMPTEPVECPLAHPPFIISDKQADEWVQRNVYHFSFFKRIRSKVEKTLGIK
jgi:hypothetical protein